jgi:hypothetical protein
MLFKDIAVSNILLWTESYKSNPKYIYGDNAHIAQICVSIVIHTIK